MFVEAEIATVWKTIKINEKNIIAKIILILQKLLVVSVLLTMQITMSTFIQ